MSRVTDAEVPFIDAAERRLLETRAIRALHERPRTATELGDVPGDVRIRPEHRPYVERLKVTGSKVAIGAPGMFTTVYYLHGDARRGVRLFIAENEERLATVLQERNNVVGQSFGEYEYRVLKEEWLLRS